MKKVILSVFVAGALLATGCKKAKEAGKDMKDATVEAADKAADATKDAANAVVDGAKDAGNAVVDGAKDAANAVGDAANAVGDAVKSAIDGVSIPKFEDPKVGEHLKAYSEYASEYIKAGKDAYKNADLMAKGKKLLAEGKTIVANLDDAGKKKFNSVMNAIQSKMAPAK